MLGLGKTTLASRVYSSSPVISHFHIRAWCTVSQIYSRYNLLVQILCGICSRHPVKYLEVDEDDLALELKRVLIKTKYLLVLDDLWDVEAWNFLKNSLPNDANRSRILITSRLQNLSLGFSEAHHLRHLTDEESWQLLQKKLFGKDGCPPSLSGVGFQMAKSCRGLPLTVIHVAGILATTAQNCWEGVASRLSSSVVLDDEYFMKTLDLSYSHLPDDLKPCLLYFGAFQVDEYVFVRRLLWLWISEGFVRATEGTSLEDVAEGYLKDLIDRSLVMVSKQGTTGGAKACRIHALVHKFCVIKAKEENFLHIIHSGKDLSSLTGLRKPYRVCDQNVRNSKISELPNLRSLLLFKKSGLMPKREYLGSKLLRVLDLGNLVFDAHFLMEVVLLVHLRYLALHIGGIESIPSAIANLSRLQTFLVRGSSWKYLLPEAIWNIKTLRHLCTTSSSCGFTFPVENLEVSPDLVHLDSLNLAIDPSSQSLENILRKLPSIRRLKCRRVRPSEEPTRTSDGTLVFDNLSRLKSLSLHFFDGYGFKFPSNLKKLTLSYNQQPWSEISTIGKLPNLEVLKLLHDSFVGEEWEMKEEGFLALRVLKLIDLHFRSWTASSESFRRLEKLVVHECQKLEEVPSYLGECATLEMIEVKGCGESVVSSVKQIQQEQMDMGIADLKIIIENCGDAWST
ncbi:unnamed protein product [Coffea canephora]|uniref:Uncharacterized protein n=1 Tax=Coffea canephora TaxID=49390 RepID=A0A068U893_COFCA|nr:unnamed protein product [Coffea canephora]